MADDAAGAPQVEANVKKLQGWVGNGTATFIIAVLTILLFGAYIFAVTFFRSILSKETQDTILGVLLTNFGYAVGYYISSSIGSANKSIELAGKK